MWLKVAASNNDPRFIASYYFKCVRQIGGWYNLILHDRFQIYMFSDTTRLSKYYQSRLWNRKFHAFNSTAYTAPWWH